MRGDAVADIIRFDPGRAATSIEAPLLKLYGPSTRPCACPGPTADGPGPMMYHRRPQLSFARPRYAGRGATGGGRAIHPVAAAMRAAGIAPGPAPLPTPTAPAPATAAALP